MSDYPNLGYIYRPDNENLIVQEPNPTQSQSEPIIQN